jgi:urea transport system permease protein
MVIWVALGGRTALAWAAAGAVIVNWAKTSISEQFPSTWLYLQGLLFVVVILFLPNGVAGAIEHLRALAARIPLPGGLKIAAASGAPASAAVAAPQAQAASAAPPKPKPAKEIA